MYRFDVYQAADGDWHWRLVAGNGEIMATGEGYTRRRDAVRAIRTLKVAVYRAEIGTRSVTEA